MTPDIRVLCCVVCRCYHQVSRHALVKLTDAKGVDIGQGVICLRAAFRSRPSWMSAIKTPHSKEEKEQKTTVTVDLSVGGKAAGSLELMIRLSKSELSDLNRFAGSASFPSHSLSEPANKKSGIARAPSSTSTLK